MPCPLVDTDMGRTWRFRLWGINCIFWPIVNHWSTSPEYATAVTVGRYRGKLQEQWADPALRQRGTDEELHHAGQNVRTRGLLIIQQTEG